MPILLNINLKPTVILLFFNLIFIWASAWQLYSVFFTLEGDCRHYADGDIETYTNCLQQRTDYLDYRVNQLEVLYAEALQAVSQMQGLCESLGEIDLVCQQTREN